MKDGLEAADGVRTASSATNGDSRDAMRPLDSNSNGLDSLGALPSNGAGGANGKATNGGGPKVGGGAAAAPGGDKTFTCRICNRCFGYKHVLQNHERTHTGEKPFECPECHKRFTRDHHLKTHMRLHTGEKPYQCPHCDRHFVQVANLRRHLRVHTGERPYACTVELCEARFSDSNQLKAHMLIHRGEKPYQCVKCLGRFRRRHHLLHHRCPKDKSNQGKPRRGRRPKAYEHNNNNNHIHTQLPPSDHDEEEDEDLDPDELLQMSEGEENILVDNSNSSPEPEIIAPTPVIVHPIVHHATNGLHASTNGNGLNGLHGDRVVVSNGSRRKPSRTIRILTPQQRELFLRDKVTMQTQAIDMSLSQSAVTVLVPDRFLEDGVLDLSSSRSDSEADLVVDPVCSTPVTCPCSLQAHFARRRPLSQRIANQRTNGSSKVVLHHHSSGSDDSNESHLTSDSHHLLSNGHISEEDDSMGPIPLTTKQNLSSSA